MAVATPGHDTNPAALVAAMTSISVFGETTNSAPALFARETSAVVTTVPTPTHTSLREASDSIIASAPGFVMVTSMQVRPALTIASAIRCPVA